MPITVLNSSQVPAGGSLTVISGTTSLAFPAIVEDSSVVNTLLVADNAAIAGLTNANFKGCTFIPQTNSDHDSVDDFQWDNVRFNIENIVDNTSIDIRASTDNGTWGTYLIKYIIIR